jgi:hypothetical protein
VPLGHVALVAAQLRERVELLFESAPVERFSVRGELLLGAQVDELVDALLAVRSPEFSCMGAKSRGHAQFGKELL